MNGVGATGLGLALTLAGAVISAKGVIVSPAAAREIATPKWDYNPQLAAALMSQSRFAFWGLVLIAVGTAAQIGGLVQVVMNAP